MFLKRWSEEQSNTASKDLFKRRSEDLPVVQSPLFQGPFQSHLQFFMWKELLQVVEPRPDLLKLRDDNSSLTVSEDKRSFHYAPESWRQPPLSMDLMNYGHRLGCLVGGSLVKRCVNVPQTFPLFSTNEFSNGQHYWEVEVGQRSFWCVGVTNHFLKFENQKYFSCKRDKSVEVSLRGVLRRVGVYLDCSSPGLSFYDAESMKQIVSVDCTGLVFPVSAYFNIQQREPDKNPIIICRY
ncbi:nuclear factor 7, ovary-like [Boleophthalmus pectinirostris]|uniref:nuclear factor 7, ovary-like n=1 Tax=Boleophthalmus pectinirostris TaxID=150288 RepID=UPI0024303C9B|nr:nuclear factor 7, ovary-like [Boleophthalmus pectinirostris]